MSDHFMIYCNRKMSKEKNSKHKDITFPSLKNYSVNNYKEALKKVLIPN